MKCALVTGSSSGLGSAIAMKLSSDLKLHIILHYHKNEEKVRAVESEILAQGGSAEIVCFDITNGEQVDAVLSTWKAQNPDRNISVLVNNAGITRDNLLVFTSESDWDAVIDTKIKGFYTVTKSIIRDMMLNRSGSVITIASMRGISGARGQVNYSAANGALIAATSALAKEAGPRNVTVNAIAPGFIESDMTAALDQQELKTLIPMGRLGTPDEIADLVSFLASNKARYISGATIPITGGLS